MEAILLAVSITSIILFFVMYSNVSSTKKSVHLMERKLYTIESILLKMKKESGATSIPVTDEEKAKAYDAQNP